MDSLIYPGFEIEGTKLVKYTGADSDVIIPEGITYIGDCAFEFAHIKTVVFPNSVTRIGESAFSQCNMLESLILNDGLETLENAAFYDCENLKKISLPRTLYEFGDEVFSGCNRIENIECNGNRFLSFVEGCLVYEGTTIIRIFKGSIPDDPNITTIDSFAFDNGDIDYLCIPENIKHIKSQAFNAINLKLLEIQNGDNLYIENLAFDCPSLTTIVFSSSCILEDGAFYIPENRMCNVFLCENKIPESFQEGIEFAGCTYCPDGHGYATFESHPGTHQTWKGSEWKAHGDVFIPEKSIVYRGDCVAAYFVGFGYTDYDFFPEICIQLMPIPFNFPYKYQYDSKIKKIALTNIFIDNVEYTKYIREFRLTQGIRLLQQNNFAIRSKAIRDAVEHAVNVIFRFEILDTENNCLESFYSNISFNRE